MRELTIGADIQSSLKECLMSVDSSYNWSYWNSGTGALPHWGADFRFLDTQPKLQDHGHGASASHGVPFYLPAQTPVTKNCLAKEANVYERLDIIIDSAVDEKRTAELKCSGLSCVNSVEWTDEFVWRIQVRTTTSTWWSTWRRWLWVVSWPTEHCGSSNRSQDSSLLTIKPPFSAPVSLPSGSFLVNFVGW